MGNRLMQSALWRGEALDIVVALHGKRSPSDPEWDHYCSLIANHRKQTPQREIRAFTVTLGGGPNSAQRQRIAAVTPKDGIAAVVTANALIRGIVTALNWIGSKQIRAFSPAESNAAIKYIGLTADEGQQFLKDMHKLGAEIDEVNPMEMVLLGAAHA